MRARARGQLGRAREEPTPAHGRRPKRDYRFVTAKGAGHCDRKVFEQTLAETLVWLWRGYE